MLSAAMMTPGWPEIAATFDGLGSRFADCIACDSEVLAADASGELAALVAFEHTTASIGGDPQLPTRCGSRPSPGAKREHRRSTAGTPIPCRPVRRCRVACRRDAAPMRTRHATQRNAGEGCANRSLLRSA
jgi:hypothetical protein